MTTARMQEVGRKPLLRFLHSPHPCGLATQPSRVRYAYIFNRQEIQFKIKGTRSVRYLTGIADLLDVIGRLGRNRLGIEIGRRYGTEAQCQAGCQR
jgi:hypothetical protein